MSSPEIIIVIDKGFPNALEELMKKEAQMIDHLGSWMVSASSYSFEHIGFLSFVLPDPSPQNMEDSKSKPVKVLIALRYILAIVEVPAERGSLGFRP